MYKLINLDDKKPKRFHKSLKFFINVVFITTIWLISVGIVYLIQTRRIKLDEHISFMSSIYFYKIVKYNITRENIEGCKKYFNIVFFIEFSSYI